MASTSTDAPAPPAIRCGFCGACATPTEPLTAFWVGAYSWRVVLGPKRKQPRSRRLACSECWALVRAKNPLDLATRSIAADLAEGQKTPLIEDYVQAYLELVLAVENPGGA